MWDIDSGRLVSVISDRKETRLSGSNSGMKILINDIAVIPSPQRSYSLPVSLSNPRNSVDDETSDAAESSDSVSMDSAFSAPQLVVAGDTIKVYNLVTGEVLKTIRSRTRFRASSSVPFSRSVFQI